MAGGFPCPIDGKGRDESESGGHGGNNGRLRQEGPPTRMPVTSKMFKGEVPKLEGCYYDEVSDRHTADSLFERWSEGKAYCGKIHLTGRLLLRKRLFIGRIKISQRYHMTLAS